MNIYIIYHEFYENGSYCNNKDVVYLSLDLNKTKNIFNEKIAQCLNHPDIEVETINDHYFECCINKYAISFEIKTFELDKDYRRF